MKEIMPNVAEIAFCGLYCGTCSRYQKGSCPGCQKNEKASWCKARSCCLENDYQSCGDCDVYADVRKCGDFSNFVSKIFAFIFKSDRPAGIDFIKKNGYQRFAEHMVRNNLQAIKK